MGCQPSEPIPGAAVPRSKPRRIGAALRLIVVVIVPLTNVLLRRDWRHGERLPAAGPVILAANHVSYADPVVLARFSWDYGRIPRFLGKAGVFSIPVIGRVLTRAGQIPVHRDTRTAVESLDAAAEALRHGQVVVIYPEGTVTRDPDFWPMTARTGVARLAQLAPGVPVLPVGQWGAQDAVDFYRHRYRLLPRKTVTVSIGMPVDLARFTGRPAGPEMLREMTDTIMSAVRQEVADIRGLVPPSEFAPRPARPPAGGAG